MKRKKKSKVGAPGNHGVAAKQEGTQSGGKCFGRSQSVKKGALFGGVGPCSIGTRNGVFEEG